MSIKIKTILLFIAFSIIPFLMVGITVFASFTAILADSASEKLQSVSQIQASRVAQTVEGYLQNVKIIASRTMLHSLVEQYHRAGSTMTGPIRALLLDSLRAINTVVDISVFNPEGRLIASSDRAKDDSSYDHETLQRAARTFFIAGVFKDEDNLIRLKVVGPLISESGTVGIIEATFSADLLMAVTEDYTGLGETGESFIARLDSSGRETELLTPLRFKGDAALEEGWGGDPLSIALAQSIIDQADMLAAEITDYRGNRVLASARYIQGTPWVLAVKVDQAEASADINRFVAQVFFLAGLVVLFIAVFASFIASNITRPLRILAQAAKRLETGDFSARVDVRGSDEISELARAFNSSAGRIKELYGTMEKKIQERTVELEAKLKTIEETNKSLEETKKATINILEDLEESKREAEENRAKDEAVIESVGEGMIVTDQYGRIRKSNKQAEAILGFSEDELVGENVLDAIAVFDLKGEKIPAEDRAVLEALTTGEKIQGNYYFLSKDGRQVPVFVTASPIMIDNQPIGVVEAFRDVTKEREVDKAKTEFVSLASHQLRTPLSAINWYTEMLLSGDAGEVSEAQRKFLKEVYNGSQRMVELVNALLNVSRIDLGTFAIDPVPTELSEIAESVLLELTAPIHAKNLKVERHYDDTIGKISADPKLIRIIIQNLLSNAVKYTPPNGMIGIDISKKGEEAIIRVYDTGYGIPKEQQGKIFTKLFRADNAREIESDGTGLGLYIVKSVMEQSGGRVWFESEEHKGSTFYVAIPLSGMKKKEGVRDLSPQM